ncbi:hypothetical protein RCS94_10915 [Orbaceae bacterium ac157xtp]
MNKIKISISLYRIFSRAYFYLPFLTIFLYLKEYNIYEISLFMAIYGASSFLFSAFIKGKVQIALTPKCILVISELIKLIGLTLFISSNNVIVYGLAQASLGISYALGSGVDSVIIYQKLKDDATSFQSKSNSYMFNSLLISGLIGGWLFELNIYYPIMATIVCTIIGLILLSILLPNNTEPPKININNSNNNILFNKEEKKLIINYAILRGIILSLFTGFLPYYFFVDLKIPSYIFILILTSYTLIGSFASKKISIYKGNKAIFFIITLFISLLLFLLDNVIGIVIATAFLGASSGGIRPTIVNELKQYSNQIYALNKAEMLYAIINFLFLILGGGLYYYYGFFSVVAFSISLLFIHVILIIKSNFKQKRESI